MKWKIVRARTTKITRATTAARHDLEHYCRDLDGWPRSWMGLEKDLPPGEQLEACFRPLFESLAASDLSPKTIQKPIDNMWCTRRGVHPRHQRRSVPERAPRFSITAAKISR